MKLGYSNLLGEHIPAEQLHHKDCEPFQVVCPACREPVFKGQREHDSAAIHYLSHYRADRAYQDDCELRVGKIVWTQVEQSNRSSRDQRLEHFLAVPQTLIGQQPIYVDGPARGHAKLNRSKCVAWMRETNFGFMRQLHFTQEQFAEAAQGYVTDITAVGGMIDTSFAFAVQQRIAWDIWTHLLTGHGRANFDFLFNHAYLQLLSRMAAARDVRALGQEEAMMYRAAAKLVEISKQRGFEIIQDMMQTPVRPPFAEPGMNLFSKLLAEITHEMIGTLLQLPYFECLRERLPPNIRHEG